MGMGSVYRVVQRFSLVNLFKKKGQGPKQEDKS
jgi:hypothetical protein